MTYQINMKKFLALALGLLCITAVAVHADDAKPKKKLTAEQKSLRKEMIEKYDTNKDGKVDKDEAKKITKEDQDKMDKAGVSITGKKKSDSTDSSTAKPADTK
jgi:hypothetical protein